MSYDIRIGVKVDGTDLMAVIAEPEFASPTYNLGDMFRAATGWNFVQGEWYKVEEVMPMINHGIDELAFHEQKYKKYNSPNGWGTTSSALQALQSMKVCIKNTVTGDWGWNEIPIEHLWIRW